MSEASGTGRIVIDGGTVVTPTETIAGGRVRIDGEHITGVEPIGDDTDFEPVGERVDASEKVVLPGLIDLHGDDVERYLFPRSGERVDPLTALTASDRLTLAAGVTTKFDAIAFEDAPEKNRSIEGATEVLDAIENSASLVADHRVHARCELTDPASVERVGTLADRSSVDIVSLMAHVPGRGQFEDDDAFASRYTDGRGAVADQAASAGRTVGSIPESTVRARATALAAAVDGTDVVLASHDDPDAAAVDRALDNGVELCEYPLTLEAAERASTRGVATAMGAPNLVRGGSLWGNLDTLEAIDAGAVDVLCSDYRPHSLLESVFADTGEPLQRRVARVTSEPARVAGLTERGRLAPGSRADIVVVDPTDVPTVTRAFVAGEEVYRCE